MKSLITGTDFIRDIDGTFKAIETNTNVSLCVDVSRYLDINVFTDFITNNNIQEIVIIHNNNNMQIVDHEGETEEKNQNYIDDTTGVNLIRLLRDIYRNTNITISSIKVDDNSITIPNVEDGEGKLIIRLAYDTTALIDDTYAKDNWEFLKLMYDTNPNLIPKTYIDDEILGFDSIGTNLRDNNDHPNYLIKKRITPTNSNIYPKLLKVNTVEELDNIKNNLQIDEYLQEFICDPNNLFLNKLKVYRSVDLIYGSNLDILHLWDVEGTNILDLVSTPDYDDNNNVQIWDRNRYVTKYNSLYQNLAIKLSADSGTKILKPNNEIITIDQLNVGDNVKSINFPSLPINTSEFSTLSWTGQTSDIVENYSIENSVVVSKVRKEYFGEIIEFQLDDGLTFSDVPHAMVLTKKLISGVTVAKFTLYQHIEIGSILFIWDNETETIVERTVTSLGFSHQSISAYSLDVSQFDLFLTLDESSNNRYGLITHNYSYDCRVFYCPSPTIYYINNTGVDPGGCALCNSGGWVVNACSLISACCRVQYGNPSAPYFEGPAYEYCDTWTSTPWGGTCVDSPYFPSPGAWCNNQKPPAPSPPPGY
jgi:hypothetical protein